MIRLGQTDQKLGASLNADEFGIINLGSLAFSVNNAALTFSGTGNHDITASNGILRLGAATLTGAITGNSQSITGVNAMNCSTMRASSSAQVGTTSVAAPTNGIVSRGNVDIGDNSQDLTETRTLRLRRFEMSAVNDGTDIYSSISITGGGNSEGNSLQTSILWNQAAYKFYTRVSSVDAYRNGHQFYVNKSVLMMPVSQAFDSSLLSGTQAFGTNGNYNTSYASFYPWVDESNNLLKFRVRYSNGTLKEGSIALT